MVRAINSDEKFNNLLDYYISCIQKEDMRTLMFNYSDRHKFHSTIFQKEEFFQGQKEQVIVEKNDTLADIFDKRRQRSVKQSIFYGYPIFINPNGDLCPVFFTELFYKENDDSITFTKESVNPDFNHYIFTGSGLQEEEIVRIRNEIDEENDYFTKIQKVIELGGFKEFQISSTLDLEITERPSRPSLYNKAILFYGEKTGFTRGLLIELQSLKQKGLDAISSTGLNILSRRTRIDGIQSLLNKSSIEIFSLNESQEKSMFHSIKNPVTVITGPPGSGKSQVVLNIIANAIWDDKTVLFASKNNQAVDVVVNKLNALLSKNLIVRMGSRVHRRNAKDEINNIIQNRNGLIVKSDPYNDAQKIEVINQSIVGIYKQIEELSDINKKIESTDEIIMKLEEAMPEAFIRLNQTDEFKYLDELDPKADLKLYNQLKFDIENQVKEIRKIEIKLEEVIASSKEPETKYILLDTHSIETILEKDIQTQIQLQKSIISKTYKLLQQAKKLSDERNLKQRELDENRRDNSIPLRITELSIDTDYSKINELELKRAIVHTFNLNGFIIRILRKLFPAKYLKREYELFSSTAALLPPKLKEPIEEIVDYNSESLRSGMELILKLKLISRMVKGINQLKEKEEHTAEVIKQLAKEEVSIFSKLFEQDKKFTSNLLAQNLNYLIIQKTIFQLGTDKEEAQAYLEKLNDDCNKVFNQYYSPFSEKVKKAFQEHIKNLDENRILIFTLTKEQKTINQWYANLESLKYKLLQMPSHYELQEEILILKKEKIEVSRQILEGYWLSKIKNLELVDENSVSRYFNNSEELERFIPEKDRWKELYDNQMTSLETIQSFLPIWVVTNLSVKSSLPLLPRIFDILIIDEASQCDIASALPLMFRAKQVVVIGDPKQLRHISNIKDKDDKQLAVDNNCTELYDDYAYSKNSIYDLTERIVKSENISPILLNQHYRSHKDIINFSNEYFYERKLNIMTDESNLVPENEHPWGIIWNDVKGKTSMTKSPYNAEECHETLKLLKSFSESNLKGVSFGVVTIFRAQSERIIDMIKKVKSLDEMDITVGTAHKFQGDEKDIIIFSPGVSTGIRQTTLNWIKTTDQLINVAITRARSALIIVGDKKKCNEAGGILMNLVGYSESKCQKEIKFDSDIEEILYSKLIEEGIKVEPQHSVQIENSKQYRLDFALFVENKKFDIEIDGANAHSQKLDADLLRDTHLRMDGWNVRRFLAEEINNNLEGVLEEIKRLC